MKEGTGVVGEHVRHVSGGQPGLDDVVAFSALGTRFNFDLDAWVRSAEVLGDLLGIGDCVFRVVNQPSDRLLAAPVAGAAAGAPGQRDYQCGDASSQGGPMPYARSGHLFTSS